MEESWEYTVWEVAFTWKESAQVVSCYILHLQLLIGCCIFHLYKSRTDDSIRSPCWLLVVWLFQRDIKPTFSCNWGIIIISFLIHPVSLRMLDLFLISFCCCSTTGTGTGSGASTFKHQLLLCSCQVCLCLFCGKTTSIPLARWKWWIVASVVARYASNWKWSIQWREF